MKPVLPAGTVISYLGVKAVVIKDGPTEFLVSCEGNHESWWWECDGHTCEVVAYPSGSTHQPESTVQGEPVLDAPFGGILYLQVDGKPDQWRRINPCRLYTAPQPAEQQPDVTQLVEALQNMLGAFDTPIIRRKVGSVFSEEAIGSAHTALAAHRKQQEGQT